MNLRMLIPMLILLAAVFFGTTYMVNSPDGGSDSASEALAAKTPASSPVATAPQEPEAPVEEQSEAQQEPASMPEPEPEQEPVTLSAAEQALQLFNNTCVEHWIIESSPAGLQQSFLDAGLKDDQAFRFNDPQSSTVAYISQRPGLSGFECAISFESKDPDTEQVFEKFLEDRFGNFLIPDKKSELTSLQSTSETKPAIGADAIDVRSMENIRATYYIVFGPATPGEPAAGMYLLQLLSIPNG